MVAKLCQTCNKSFEYDTHGYGGVRTQIYCSKKCAAIAHRRKRRQRDYNPCPNCGHLKHKTSEYCQHCYGQFHLGENNKGWKGGRTSHEGYVIVRQPEHPRANQNGYVLEHILIWEQTHNKPLPKGWIIHHLNGIKYDNRPVNLLALSSLKHFLVLKAKAKRIQELEALLNNQHQLL